MSDRTRTVAPKFGDGDVGGLVAGKTLLDAIEIRFRLAGAGPSPLSVDGRRLRRAGRAVGHIDAGRLAGP